VVESALDKEEADTTGGVIGCVGLELKLQELNPHEFAQNTYLNEPDSPEPRHMNAITPMGVSNGNTQALASIPEVMTGM